MFLVVKILVITGAFSFASVELGAEFFTSVNTALNLMTVIWVSRQSQKLNIVKDTLDTRRAGGRRELDPGESNE